MALDGGDQRFGKQHSRRPHWTIALLRQLIAASAGDGLQIRSSTESPARTGEHGDAKSIIRVECPKRIRQLSSSWTVDGVAHFGTVNGDDQNVIVLLDQNVIHKWFSWQKQYQIDGRAACGCDQVKYV